MTTMARENLQSIYCRPKEYDVFDGCVGVSEGMGEDPMEGGRGVLNFD